MSSSQLATLLCVAGAVAWNASAASYYEEFLLQRGTNTLSNRPLRASSLVDTNNTSCKWSGLLSEIRRAKEFGEISGVRPGMTMEDVVARWGKPRALWSLCFGGPRLVYTDVSVIFDPKTNRADAVRMEVFAHSDSAELSVLTVESLHVSLEGSEAKKESRLGDSMTVIYEKSAYPVNDIYISPPATTIIPHLL